jgi:hypothetical protein
MEKIDVLWCIEHIAREMDVACAVKCLAEARYGLKIEIRHLYLHARESMERYQPAVVALPFFYNSKDLALEDYVRKWPSAIIFNLAWEEIFYKGHLKLKAPADDFTRRRVIHHAWGDFFKRYLLENGVEERHVFLNGNPAYQLYLGPYSEYYRDRGWLAQKYGLDKDKRWVIVPENYRWAFITDATIDWRSGQGSDRAELLAMREFAGDSLGHLLGWCNAAAARDRLEIIFRPKPVTMLTEMEDFYNRRVGGSRPAGLHLIKGESVREWILAGDVVISSFSTTLIEAAIAGRPTYMVEPLPISESFAADWYQYVPRIRNETEFDRACREQAAAGADRLKAWAAGEMLANGDPISRLADFLHDLVKRPPAPVTLRSRLAQLAGQWRHPYRKTYFNPRTHENDRFDDDDVDRKVDEWSKILPKPGDR